MTTSITLPRLLKIDAIGAGLSIILLFVIYQFESYTGMPAEVVFQFIISACFILAYSLFANFANPAKTIGMLKRLAILNLCYCAFTGYHVYQNLANLSVFGLIYFVGEISVIVSLALIELDTAWGAKNN